MKIEKEIKMINKLIKGDNIEIMKSIDENYVDLIITSPPYDDLRDYEKKINWNFEIFKEVAKEMFRVLKELNKERLTKLEAEL